MIDKNKLHEDLCLKLHEIYVLKNHDYGDSFHKTFETEGFAAARIRLTDKLNRFNNLSRGTKIMVDNESMKDTLLDLANYALLTILEIEANGDGNNEKTDEINQTDQGILDESLLNAFGDKNCVKNVIREFLQTCDMKDFIG